MVRTPAGGAPAVGVTANSWLIRPLVGFEYTEALMAWGHPPSNAQLSDQASRGALPLTIPMMTILTDAEWRRGEARNSKGIRPERTRSVRLADDPDDGSVLILLEGDDLAW
jgi:hypothetical protein